MYVLVCILLQVSMFVQSRVCSRVNKLDTNIIGHLFFLILNQCLLYLVRYPILYTSLNISLAICFTRLRQHSTLLHFNAFVELFSRRTVLGGLDRHFQIYYEIHNDIQFWVVFWIVQNYLWTLQKNVSLIDKFDSDRCRTKKKKNSKNIHIFA